MILLHASTPLSMKLSVFVQALNRNNFRRSQLSAPILFEMVYPQRIGARYLLCGEWIKDVDSVSMSLDQS